MKKQVKISQVREDLHSGLTRWKKDDIGFGSIEKKYGLTVPEMIELLAHPKIKNIESRIPTFIIIDDVPDEESTHKEQQEETTSKIEVAAPVQQQKPQQQTTLVIKQPVQEQEEEEELVAFI